MNIEAKFGKESSKVTKKKIGGEKSTAVTCKRRPFCWGKTHDMCSHTVGGTNTSTNSVNK